MTTSYFWRLALTVLSLLVLSGCGEVLDWRNAEVSQGKVYRRGADSAYSGKVTNIPLNLIAQPKAWPEMFQPMVSLGPVFNNFRAFGSLCTAKFRKGVADGKVRCEFPDGRLHVEIAMSDGMADGDYVMYDGTDDKKKIVTARFSDGHLDGKHEIFSPQTGRRVFIAPYVDGKLEGELAYFMEDTGVKVETKQFKNGRLEGEHLMYTTDGKTLVQRTNYRDGSQEGIEEKFSRTTGKKISEEHYVRGNRQGEAKRWDEAGNLISTSGAGISPWQSPSVADIEACADKWLVAHRKEVGPDAPVSAGQFGEWEGWCREGKQPS